MEAKMFLIFVAQMFSFGASEATGGDLDAWMGVYDSLGGSSWDSCSGKRENPCTCGFVTCGMVEGTEMIREIEFPSSLYSGDSIEFSSTLFSGFNYLRKLQIGPSAWVQANGDECFALKDGYTFNSDTCSHTGNYGFCCFEEYLEDFFDTFGGPGWSSCSGRRETLCDCNPGSNKDVAVSCTKGVASNIRLVNNGLAFDGSSTDFPISVLNNLFDSGLESLNIMDNTGIVLGSSDCPFISGCDGKVCKFPDSFTTCVPTNSPTESPTTSSPTLSPVSCDYYSDMPNKRKAKNLCNKAEGCEWKNKMCMVATPEPTTSPFVLTCDSVNGYEGSRMEKKKLCNQADNCEFKKGVCFEETESPTHSPSVPTVPTASPTVDCDSLNELPQRQRKRQCRAASGCQYNGRDNTCSIKTDEPTMSPQVPVAEPTESPVLPCAEYNSLKLRQRKRQCRKDDDCMLNDMDQCVLATAVPSLSPTTPTVFSCEGVSGDNRREAKSNCDEYGELGCVFAFNPRNKNNEYRCFELYNSTGSLICEGVNNLYTTNMRKNACSEEEYCFFDNSGDNKGGYCFEIENCEDINSFGSNSRIKTFCESTNLNGGLECHYNADTKMCQNSILG